MSKKHYFKINEDFASRSLARLYGLKEEKPGIWSIVEHSVTSSEHRSNIRSAERAFTKIKITEAQDLAEVLPPVAAAAAAVARQQAVAKGTMQSIGGATASNAFMSAADRLGAGQTGETNLSNIQAPESLEQGNAPKKLKKDVRGAKFRKQSKQQSVAEGDNSNLTKVMVPKVGQRVIADVSGYGRFGLYGTEPGVIVRIPSPRLIKVRIDKDGEIYDFDNNELYQRGLTDSKLNELDLFAPRITYIKIHNGQWVKAKYRATQTLGTEGDNPTFVDFSYVSDDAANRMGLNQRLKAGTTGRRPAGKITIANPGPTQQTGPFGPTNIDLIDLSNPDFNADEKLLSQLNQWLEKTPSLNKTKGVVEDSGKIFTVVYYSKQTDRNVTKQIKASSESELWDKLRAKGIDVISVKEQGVAEGGPFSYGAKKPRKGSVAHNAELERKKQEKSRSPIEPKNQMVGTAKVTKDVEKGQVNNGYKKLHNELWQIISEQIIDENQLNEIDMGFITNFVAVAPILSSLIVKNAVKKAQQESDQTELMVDVMKKRINDQPVTPQETKVMREQFKDLVSYGVIALGSVLATASAGPLAGAGIALAAVYKKELIDLIRNQGPEVIINLLKTRGNIDVINQLMIKFFDRNVAEGFAGEKVGQKPGDQVRGTERAKKSKKQHPFKGRLVGDGA